MKGYQNLIKLHSKVISSKLCGEIIEFYKNNKIKVFNSGIDDPSFNLEQTKQQRNSKELILVWDDPNIKNITQPLKNIIGPLVKEYLNYYTPMYESLGDRAYYEVGHILKYEPNEGFYNFHYDNDGDNIKNRLITIIVYLNDVEEGGKTEFQYLNTPPIKPQKGDVLIFPSGWEHTHKGNIPLSNSKYICVFWLIKGIQKN